MPDLISPEVIHEAMAGSTAAFRRLVEYYQGFAYSVAFRFVRDEEEAEDIVQEAFVRLWKNLSAYRAEIKLTTWLYRIVTNLCLDFLKSKRGQERRSRDDITKGYHAADRGTPEKEYERGELMRIVLDATEALTPKQKAVFILRDLEGLSVEEVTEILSMSAGNVKSNLFYARKSMGEKLKAYYQITNKSTFHEL
jgi:RNA polymerase sigma-70 factor (ECF subfamily)